MRLNKSAPFVLCALLTAPLALANSGQAFTWSFQNTTLNDSFNIAAAMRNNLAWPVVVTDTVTSNGYGASATLFPTVPSTGSPYGSTWQNIGSNFFSTSPANRLRAASSPDGRVAFAAVDPSGNAAGGRVSSVAGGWSPLPTGTKAVAFDSKGNLYTATATSVSGIPGYSGASIVDLAIAPTGEVGVVSQDMKFSQYSAWLGNWTSINLPYQSTPNTPDSIDLQYDSLGRPHVLTTVANTIVAYDFSTVTGSWQATTIATGISSIHVTLAANADDTVGTSWIDTSGNLVYAFKHDTGNWISSIVTDLLNPNPSQVGISYDYANLPVLAYSTPTGLISVAYDPIVLPEPTTLSLLPLAMTGLLRRTRRIQIASELSM